MVFHLGKYKCRGFCELSEVTKPENERTFVHPEMQEAILVDINDRLFDEKHMLRMNWVKGDIGFLDNRAVAHLASPNSQRPVEEVGYRLLHRVTVESEGIPTK